MLRGRLGGCFCVGFYSGIRIGSLGYMIQGLTGLGRPADKLVRGPWSWMNEECTI